MLLISFLLLFPKTSKASCMWGDWCSGEMFQNALDEISYEIHSVLVGALKEMSLETITEDISDAISSGGDDGGPMFITDWEDFLVNDPVEEANLYMDDFFSTITSGRGSISYSGSGGGGYQASLVAEAKKLTVEASIPTCEVTNSMDALTSNNWSSFAKIVGVDTCNKLGFNNIAQEKYASKISEKQSIYQTQSLAYSGYKAKLQGGIVITPGSTVEEIQAQAEDLGKKIIAGATTVPEVLTALVAELATKALDQGIGQAQQYVQEASNKVNNYSNQVNSQLNSLQRFEIQY